MLRPARLACAYRCPITLTQMHLQLVICTLHLQVILLALLKGAVAYIFTLLLMSLLIVIVVVEGAAAVSAASAQFEGHNAGYAIAFGWYDVLSRVCHDYVHCGLPHVACMSMAVPRLCCCWSCFKTAVHTTALHCALKASQVW